MSPRVSDKEIGKNIRGLRKRKGLSQADLADTRYTSAYVSLIEAGKRSPSRAALTHFAERLGVTEEDLVRGRQPDLELEVDLEIQEAKGLIYGGNVEEASATLTKLMAKARRYKLKISQARIHETLGLLFEQEGRTQDALEQYRAAEDALLDEPDVFRVGAVTGIARTMQRLGDTSYAVYVLEQLLLSLTTGALPDPSAVMRVYSSLVGAYFELGLTDKAVRAANEAERLIERGNNADQIASTYLTIARSHLEQGRRSEALRALMRGEDMYSRLGWASEAAGARISRGVVFAEQGDLTEARDVLALALEDLGTHGDPILRAKGLNQLAHVERLRGNATEALHLLDQAQKLIARHDAREQGFNSRERGLALMDKDAPEAEEMLRRAVDLYRQAGDRPEVASSLKVLGDLLISKGRTDEALAAYREGIEAVAQGPRQE